MKYPKMVQFTYSDSNVSRYAKEYVLLAYDDPKECPQPIWDMFTKYLRECTSDSRTERHSLLPKCHKDHIQIVNIRATELRKTPEYLTWAKRVFLRNI